MAPVKDEDDMGRGGWLTLLKFVCVCRMVTMSDISFWFPFSWSWPSSDDEPSLKAGYDLHYNDNITHEYPGEDMDMVDKDMIWLHHNDNIIHEYHGEDMDMVDMDITIKT